MSGEMDFDEIRRAFDEAVNMSPKELEDWLATAESRSVGAKTDGESESVGHESGRRIVAIKRTKKAELTEDDYRHMRKVSGYVRRHLAQGGPERDKRESAWRHSLMNWGHDPLRG